MARPDDRKVIDFVTERPRIRRFARAVDVDDGARGRILLFTGVRCERFVDEAAFLAALASPRAEDRRHS